MPVVTYRVISCDARYDWHLLWRVAPHDVRGVRRCVRVIQKKAFHLVGGVWSRNLGPEQLISDVAEMLFRVGARCDEVICLLRREYRLRWRAREEALIRGIPEVGARN